MDDLSQIEWACKELYTTSDPAIRAQAEKTCSSLCERPDCVATCQALLQRANSCYSQFIAATALTRFISNKDAVLHVNTRLELRNFALNYLVSRSPLESFVQQTLVVLICRLTKLGWFDSIEKGPEWPFRDLMDSANKCIQSGQLSGVLIGVQLMSNLVDEISQTSDSDLTRAVFFLRKMSMSFRDTLLFPIFQLGLNLLQETDQNLKTIDALDPSQTAIVQHSLRLALSCLSYDFLGTSVGSTPAACDDFISSTGDDLMTVQLPTAWRPVFLECSTVQLFFRLFAGLPSQLRPLTISCLVQMASIRRSLFSNTERQSFLTSLMTGALSVLREHAELLREPLTYHEFCRFLSRIKCNFQLSELMQVEGYADFLRLVAEFTVHSLRNSSNVNSLHYLLVLWQRLVASIPYVRSADPYQVDTYAPQVACAFIQSRLDEVPTYAEQTFTNDNNEPGQQAKLKARLKAARAPQAAVGKLPSQQQQHFLERDLDDGDDDDSCPLDDTLTLAQQLDQFAVIGRCDYTKTCQLIVQLFDLSASNLQSALERFISGGTFNPNAIDVSVLQAVRVEENRLAWLVYLIGSLIGSRTTLSTTVDNDQLDGELVSRVLKLMRLLDMRLMVIASSPCGQDVVTTLCSMSAGASRLELAIINFLEHFRRTFVGENINRVSNIYQSLASSVGVSDEIMMLRVFTAKILSNLRYWSAQDVVLQPTLALFGELASSYSAMRKLLRLDDINFMLMNHTPENFRFLSPPEDTSTTSASCYRTEFYSYLSRLLLVDLAEDGDRFLNFLLPLSHTANSLLSNLLVSNTCPISSDQARNGIIGLARDLAGVAFSLNTKSSFQMFLDWFYPSCFTLFGRALELWPFDPQVLSPILKLLTEVIHNRNGRLMFDATIPMGYLLLSEMAKILVSAGSRLLPYFAQVPKESTFSHKIKPLTRLINALRTTVAGNFANFAIFGLVGDDSFEKAIELGAQLLMCVSDDELRSYTKLARAYFSLLECLTQDHMVLLSSLDATVFRRVFDAIVVGVDSLEVSISGSSCFCLDHILTHIYKLLNTLSGSSKRTVMNGDGNIDDGGGGDSVSADGSDPRRLIFVEMTATTGGSSEPAGCLAAAARQRLASLPPEQRQHGTTGLAIWSNRAVLGNANLRRLMQSDVGQGPQAIGLIFRRLLVTFLAAFMNEECKNQWGMSRPLLGLILLNQEYFTNLQNAVINTVSPDHRAKVKALFSKLMDDVEGNLFAKNRDKFTQNTSAFRHAITEFMKSASVRPLPEGGVTSPADPIGESFSLRSILISAAGFTPGVNFPLL
uniref:Exportin-7 n=1 Tax=Schistocephalus solidus TaxID=70667 RepID=A0A0X3P2S5_SCHSO